MAPIPPTVPLRAGQSRGASAWCVAAALLLHSMVAMAQTAFQDPAGRFSLTVPKGWTVANRDPLVVTARDASVTVMTAEGNDVDRTVQGLLGQVEGQWTRWQELKRGTTSIGGQRGPVVFASGNNPKGVPAFFRISAAPAGNAVLVVMASVPQDRFADAKPAIEALEASVAVGGRARGPEAPAPRGPDAGQDKRLAALDKALEAGVLTQEEYDAKKRAMLASGGGTKPPTGGGDAPAANRAWLGVASRNIEPQEQESLQLRQGALVAQIAPGSPAEAAGVQPGDVIVAVDGAAITDASALIQAIGRKRPGETASLRVVRRGQTGELQARLVAPPPRQ